MPSPPARPLPPPPRSPLRRPLLLLLLLLLCGERVHCGVQWESVVRNTSGVVGFWRYVRWTLAAEPYRSFSFVIFARFCCCGRS